MVRLREFVRNSRGAVSVVFASTLVVLTAGVGLSFDAANLFKAREALQAAADGAALAVSADTITSNVQISALAKKYLSTNAPPLALVQVNRVSASFDPNTKTVTVSVTGAAPTTFMSLVGLQAVNVSATAKAKRGDTGPLDLVLALDMTDSMNESIGGATKIVTLKAAAKSLVNSIMTSSNARVGIVPFANYVNIDKAYRGEGWLAADEDVPVQSCGLVGTEGDSGTCQFESYPCVIDGLNAVCKRLLSCTGGTPGSIEYRCWVSMDSWNGCLQSRMYNGEYLTTISSPTSPPYPGKKMRAATLPAGADGNGCSSSKMTELTAVKSTISEALLYMFAGGETFIPDGLIWSWNMLTKDAPLTTARSYQEMGSLGGKKALVLMTDGYNTRYAGAGGWHFPINGDADKQAATDNATREICARIKAEGIIIYTVAFGVADPGIKTILQGCASSPSKFFDAADTSALNASFGKIGTELQRVRLMQ